LPDTKVSYFALWEQGDNMKVHKMMLLK